MKEINVKMLEIAKELLIMEYNDRKAQDHNRWLIESERAWITSRTKLEHPPFPQFPTNADILTKAKTLMGIVDITDKPPESKVETPVEVQEITPTEPVEVIKETSETSVETVETSVTETPVEIVEEVKSSTETVENSNTESDTETKKQELLDKFSKDKIPAMKQYNLPENLLAYSRIKVANNMDSRIPGSARIITNLMESFRRDKNKEK